MAPDVSRDALKRLGFRAKRRSGYDQSLSHVDDAPTHLMTKETLQKYADDDEAEFMKVEEDDDSYDESGRSDDREQSVSDKQFACGAL